MKENLFVLIYLVKFFAYVFGFGAALLRPIGKPIWAMLLPTIAFAARRATGDFQQAVNYTTNAPLLDRLRATAAGFSNGRGFNTRFQCGDAFLQPDIQFV